MKILNSLTTTRIRISKALWLFSLLFLSAAFGQEGSELSFLFVGDVMQHDGQIEAAFNKTTGAYEYDDGFKFVKPIINQYDYRVANLEVTLAGKPYKGYPQFSAPDELGKTIVDAGFNIILTANNHSCDRGSQGVIRTLDQLDKIGVLHTGTFRSQKERDENYPLIVEKNGMRVAMLNYTYGTNGLSVAAPLIINYIDSTVIKKDIEKAKALKADYIVCNMHWGTEYKPLPNGYQKRFESYCYELGADMVIGGHPHVVQPIERKEVNGSDKLTVWSLGNFVSNMSVRYTRGGVMVGATVKKEKGKVKLIDAEEWLVYVHKKQEGTVKQYYILPDFDYNKYRPDFLSTADIQKMEEFFKDSRELYGEHNISVKESKIAETDKIGKMYQLFLTEYYSVLVSNDRKLMEKQDAINNYLHQTVDLNGKYYILSGVCKTKEQATGNKRFIQDCGLSSSPKLVLVKPTGIEVVSE